MPHAVVAIAVEALTEWLLDQNRGRLVELPHGLSVEKSAKECRGNFHPSARSPSGDDNRCAGGGAAANAFST
jgi:hypothetical protein